MTVKVRTDDIKLTIPVPLLLISPALKIVSHFAEIDEWQIKLACDLIRELRRARHHHRGLELVHVIDSDGDEVIVRL